MEDSVEVIPELTAEQKLAIRELQFRITSYYASAKEAEKRIGDLAVQYANSFNIIPNDYIFDLGTLQFRHK